MLKRERDETLDKGEGVGNGNKIQRMGAAIPDEAPVDSRLPGSQDAVAGLLARKQPKARLVTGARARDDVRHEVYREGRRFKFEGPALPEDEPIRLLVRIPVDHLQFHNRQVKARQLWGVDVYTHDSDLVAVLMHCGYVSAASGVPREVVAEAQVLIEYLPRQPAYPSCYRNGVRSRAWGEYAGGFSLKVVRCVLLTRTGQEEEVPAAPSGMSLVVPTFMPSQFERIVSTRASASSVERRQRAMQEVPMQYNLCNEPWLKYSMPVIADRGLKPSQLTSARLHSEVLYLETAMRRFEVSLEDRPAPGEQPDPSKSERYRFLRCKKAYPLSKMRKLGIPLPAEEVEPVETGLLWEDIQWSPAGAYIKGKEYALLRLHFTGIVPPSDSKPPPSLPAPAAALPT